jgi:hypothetical protein
MGINREAIKQAIADTLGDAYDCTRVWQAWGYGTMGPDDFVQVAEQDDRLEELTDAVIAAIGAASTPQPADGAADQHLP